jgi:seryl-tRNA synthetase
VHQFHKVEMFVYCRPEDAEAEHERLLDWSAQMLDKCELPYRIIDTAAGDLGDPAARKFDSEGWVPSRAATASSRRRRTARPSRRDGWVCAERDPQGTGATRVVATLNGTLATTRWIVAILENHQQADGSVVRVPEALRPFMGGLDVLTPVR